LAAHLLKIVEAMIDPRQHCDLITTLQQSLNDGTTEVGQVPGGIRTKGNTIHSDDSSHVQPARIM
jgi:hypothetical protein